MSGIDFYVTLTKLSFGTYLSGYKITDDGLSETGRDFVWHEEKRVLDLLNVSSLEEFEKNYPNGSAVRLHLLSERNYNYVLKTADLSWYRKLVEFRWRKIYEVGLLEYLRWLAGRNLTKQIVANC